MYYHFACAFLIYFYFSLLNCMTSYTFGLAFKFGVNISAIKVLKSKEYLLFPIIISIFFFFGIVE